MDYRRTLKITWLTGLFVFSALSSQASNPSDAEVLADRSGDAHTDCNVNEECDAGQPFCVDHVCCTAPCEDGRCDKPGSVGFCIPDDIPCDCDPLYYYCDEFRNCLVLHELGEPCDSAGQCSSAVCDLAERICCDHLCNGHDEYCNTQGHCVVVTATPHPSPTPTRTSNTLNRTDTNSSGGGCFIDRASQPLVGPHLIVALLVPLSLWVGRHWRRRRAQRT